MVAAGVLALVMVLVVRPSRQGNVASLAVLAVPVLLVLAVRRRLLARAVLRARWPSVARSAGLAVRRDRRGRQWPFDSTTTLGDEVVEYLPVISRPRSVPGVGVRFRLRPARGGTVADVAEASEAVAAGLRVQRVEVTRHRPDRGELLVVWR